MAVSPPRAERPRPKRPWTGRRVARGIARHGPAVGLDFVATTLAYLLAIGVRTSGQFDTPEPGRVVVVAAIEIGLFAVAANIFVRAYWRDWSVAALEDLVALAAANGAVAALVGVMEWLANFHPIPYTAIVAGAGLSLVAQSGLKLQPRWSSLVSSRMRRVARDHVIVVGAGRTGQLLARDLSDGSRGFRIACFVDDEPRRWGTYVRGVRVAGGMDELPRLIDELKPAAVVIAIPRPGGDLVRRVVDATGGTDTVVRAVSGFSLAQDIGAPLRQIGIDELLEREAVDLNNPETRAYLGGKRVLITGAAGSIGSEIARQVAGLKPSRLLLLDTNESGLHDLTQALALPEAEIVLGDVRDAHWLGRLFERERPEVVFHAAAYKHVPIVETTPLPAVGVNILGTANVLACATRGGTRHFVFISTDKAVQPANVLGVTKRFGELLTMAYAEAYGRDYAVVRFGNVLGSAGSVVPTFTRQIEHGGPITVTHPEVTRFFMTIPEAAGLVIQAGAIARGADLLLLDMGRAVPIADLAEKMVRLRGLRVPADIRIEFTGLRPGEKLEEALHYPDEICTGTDNPRVLRVTHGPPVPHLSVLQQTLRQIESCVADLDDDGAIRLLAEAISLGADAQAAANVLPLHGRQ